MLRFVARGLFWSARFSLYFFIEYGDNRLIGGVLCFYGRRKQGLTCVKIVRV